MVRSDGARGVGLGDAVVDSGIGTVVVALPVKLLGAATQKVKPRKVAASELGNERISNSCLTKRKSAGRNFTSRRPLLNGICSSLSSYFVPNWNEMKLPSANGIR
jgi:hypothetical protein